MGAVSAALAGTAVLGGAVSAYGQIEQGRAQRAIGNMNAAQSREDAAIALEAGKDQAAIIRRTGRELLGKQQAIAGASGLAMSGSILDVMADSARMNELDALKVEYASKLDARSLERQARIQEFGGEVAEKQSKLGAISSILGAGFNAGTSLYGGSRGVGFGLTSFSRS